MKWAAIILFLSYLTANNYARQAQVIQKGKENFLRNKVIVKINNEFLSTLTPSILAEQLNKKFSQQVVKNVEGLFTTSATLQKGKSFLNGIFIVTTNDNENPGDIAQALLTLPEVEWAEPKYVRQVCYNPNDEFFTSGTQSYLDVIKASAAWEVTKGSKEVVIAIIDTGVDIDHPDLTDNIFLNKMEIPDNGKDEDDFGEFADDIHGWDFGGESGTPDNDPREDFSPLNGYHGTHVSGIASAVTDNNYGVASIGYNCKILPVKASEQNIVDENNIPKIIYGFEGIKYAVDKGAKIICCSWGGYEFSRFEQEIIDYAVSKGVLVVAAAGNDNSQRPFYPASYKGVLSVGWSNNDDTRSIASNYGNHVDVMAPGTGIYSTWPLISSQNSPFKFAGGSSMSAPLVAGLAGLVISKYPNLTPLQTAERMRVTSENIEEKNSSMYKNLLGSGRVNAFDAVSEKKVFSLRATDVQLNQKVHHNVEWEDTTEIQITFTNYLNPIVNASVTISTSEPFVKIINNTFETGSLAEFSTVGNSFSFTLEDQAPTDTTIYFLLKYDSPVYKDFQWIEAKINPSFVTHNNGKLEATITNIGGIGFSDLQNQIGDGFKLSGGSNILNEGSFLFGNSAQKLIDGVRQTKAIASSDFKILKSVSLYENKSANESLAIFNDGNAGPSFLGIETQIRTYTFNSAPDDAYLLIEAALKNTMHKDIKNLHAGYFLDFNLSEDAFSDSTYYDVPDNFAYVTNKNQQKGIVGAALLTKQKAGYTSINNNWRVGEVILLDGFSDEEKWYSISSDIHKEKIYGDVSFTISGGPFSILAGETETVAFVIAIASNKEELRQIIRQSRKKNLALGINQQDGLPTEHKLNQNYPNPFNPETTITYHLPKAELVTLKVYDILGREIESLVNEYKQAGVYSCKLRIDNGRFSSGVYFYRLQCGGYSETKKMILIK